MFLVFRGRITGPFRTAVLMLLGVTVLQAVIGFTQYYNGIPALLVGAHMLGAALLMSAATNAADLARSSPVEVVPAALMHVLTAFPRNALSLPAAWRQRSTTCCRMPRTLSHFLPRFP